MEHDNADADPFERIALSHKIISFPINPLILNSACSHVTTTRATCHISCSLTSGLALGCVRCAHRARVVLFEPDNLNCKSGCD